MNKLTKDPEYYIIVGATGICVLVSILDFSGLLSAIPWLAQRIPTFMLLMLSTVLGYLVVERKNKLEAIEALTKIKSKQILQSIGENADKIIALIERGDICILESRADTYSYFQKRIAEAKRYIDITHFSSEPAWKNSAVSPDRTKYYETLSTAIKERKLRVRRVMTVKDIEHLEWVREMLSEFSGYPFYLGCYHRPSPDIPMISLMIFDGEEIAIGAGERSASYDAKTILVKNPIFAKVMQEHFDSLWRNSSLINERGIRDDLIDELEKSLQK